MLTTSREQATAGSEAIGLKVEGAVGGRCFECGEIGLLYLESAHKENLVFDACGLEEIAKLKMVNVDTGGDDGWVSDVDVLNSSGHDEKLERRGVLGTEWMRWETAMDHEEAC